MLSQLLQSHDWLTTLSVSLYSQCLINTAVRVAVDLWFALDLCSHRQCPCNGFSWHGLSGKLAFGQSFRYYANNDIVWQAWMKADVPNTKKPRGLFCSVGRDQKELQRFPGWKANIWPQIPQLVVYACFGILHCPLHFSWGCSWTGCQINTEMYSGLPATQLSQLIDFKTLGPINSAGVGHIREFGHHLFVQLWRVTLHQFPFRVPFHLYPWHLLLDVTEDEGCLPDAC